jgi:SAM-dependent methyltransferase
LKAAAGDPFKANSDFYASARVVSHYANNTSLSDSELKILARHEEAIRRAELLDIGVGAGRTVPHLRARAAHYAGIDYSQPMIDRCRERFPEAFLLRCDVRDLSPFANESFDAAYAIFNGLDELLPEERLRALGEIRRVLRTGGLFFFSSHNIGWRSDVRDDPAIVMEQMMGADLPTYYIGPTQQVAQLDAAGFETIEVSDVNGDVVAGLTTSPDPWLHYVARKHGHRSHSLLATR